MSKHTPGPWSVVVNRDERRIKAPDQGDIAIIVNWSQEVDEADARLIAAAPDMLEALLTTRRLVVEAAQTGFNYADGDWAGRLFANQALISAAIRKATGEQS